MPSAKRLVADEGILFVREVGVSLTSSCNHFTGTMGSRPMT